MSASTVAELDQAFVRLGQQRPDALMIGTKLLFTTQRQLVVALTARHDFRHMGHHNYRPVVSQFLFIICVMANGRKHDAYRTARRFYNR